MADILILCLQLSPSRSTVAMGDNRARIWAGCSQNTSGVLSENLHALQMRQMNSGREVKQIKQTQALFFIGQSVPEWFSHVKGFDLADTKSEGIQPLARDFRSEAGG